MKRYNSDFLKESQERGFIHQGTDLEALDRLMKKNPITAYIGFDATGDSLHVGSLIQIMWLRLLQKHGHRPIVLLGDGTTRIGDPSGKDTARRMLSEEDIENNVKGIGKIFERFLIIGDGPNDATVMRNYGWLKKLNYLDFLREYGRHFSINRMMGFESVKSRLDREQNLSFLEFNYMILQAYDFLELHRRQNCILQLGGSDQWGNIVSGTDLIRRTEGSETYGLTAPLIMTVDGKKMGKTEQGAIWLNKEKLSPFEYWQFWRNTQDQDVSRFLRLFTDLRLPDIERLEKLQGAEINEAKKVLANEATRLCHGSDAVEEALKTAEGLFSKSQDLASDASLPTIKVDQKELEKGFSVVDLLIQTGLASSKGDARRLIRGGGARLNDERIESDEHKATPEDLNEQGFIKLSAGKKRHALARVS